MNNATNVLVLISLILAITRLGAYRAEKQELAMHSATPATVEVVATPTSIPGADTETTPVFDELCHGTIMLFFVLGVVLLIIYLVYGYDAHGCAW